MPISLLVVLILMAATGALILIRAKQIYLGFRRIFFADESLRNFGKHITGLPGATSDQKDVQIGFIRFLGLGFILMVIAVFMISLSK